MSQQSFRFLELPPELRVTIYIYIIDAAPDPDPDVAPQIPPPNPVLEKQDVESLNPIRQTCRQIRAEIDYELDRDERRRLLSLHSEFPNLDYTLRIPSWNDKRINRLGLILRLTPTAETKQQRTKREADIVSLVRVVLRHQISHLRLNVIFIQASLAPTTDSQRWIIFKLGQEISMYMIEQERRRCEPADVLLLGDGGSEEGNLVWRNRDWAMSMPAWEKKKLDRYECRECEGTDGNTAKGVCWRRVFS